MEWGGPFGGSSSQVLSPARKCRATLASETSERPAGSCLEPASPCERAGTGPCYARVETRTHKGQTHRRLELLTTAREMQFAYPESAPSSPRQGPYRVELRQGRAANYMSVDDAFP